MIVLNLVCAEKDARKLKMHIKQTKHKQVFSSLYVCRRNVNFGVGNEKVC